MGYSFIHNLYSGVMCEHQEEYDHLMHHVVHEDEYGFLGLAERLPVDYLVDIGGNIGITDLWFHVWYPDAKIITLEPCLATFEYLKHNTSKIPNIQLINKAFGTGDDLYMAGYEGTARCYLQTTLSGKSFSTNENPFPTITLDQVFQDIPDDAPYYLKVDCEGGERFLLHEKILPYLLRADYIGMVYHPGDRITLAEAEAIRMAVEQDHIIVGRTGLPDKAGIERAIHKKWLK